MKYRPILAFIMALAIFAGVVVPATASAQSLSQQSAHRQKTKNDWRNAAYLGAGLATWGLLKNDSTLVFAGTVGALYSASRYEHDRKSQSKLDRTRASLFSRSSFVRDGKTYRRYTTYKKGKKYYYFKCTNPGANKGKKKGWDKNGKRG